MQYKGNLYIGADSYYLIWTKNKTRDRFLIYSRKSIQDLERLSNGERARDAELSISILDTSKLHDFNNYLVCGIITAPKGGISQYIGDFKIIKKFINAYETITKKSWSTTQYKEKAEIHNGTMLKNIIREDENSYFKEIRSLTDVISFNFKINDVEFITTNREDKSVTSPVKGVNWFTIEEYMDKSLRDKFNMLHAKTLAQLMNEKDLSPFFDRHGNKLKKYKIINTMEGVKKVVDILKFLIRTRRPFSVDTETTGLNIYDISPTNPDKDHIVGMSITWADDQGIYIPYDHVEIDNVNIREALTLLKPCLEQGHIIAHNGVYDMKVFIDAGLYGICDGKGGIGEPIYLNVKEDTMILNFCINASASKGRNGLKYLTHTLLGVDTLELSDIFAKKSDAGLFRYLTRDLVEVYACADTDFTFKLWKLLRKKLHPSGRRVYQNDVNTAYFIARSEYYGNGLNIPLLRDLKEINDKDLETLEELLYSFVGKMGKLTQLAMKLDNEVYKNIITKKERDEKLIEFQKSDDFKNSRYKFKISSNDEIAVIMYKLLNYPVLRVIQDTGKPSVDKDTLKDLIKFTIEEGEKPQTILQENIYSAIVNTEHKSKKDDENILIDAKKLNSLKYPFAYILSVWRKLEKLKTAFYDPYYKNQIEEKCFAPFKLCNAETGRITNKVQTLKGALKKLVIPLTPDHYLCVFDYAQVEYRAVAGLAGDIPLIQALIPPRADYHREGGAKFYGVQPHEITKAQRSDLKVANFAKLYKMSDPSLADTLYGREYNKKQREINLMNAHELSAKWEIVNYKEKKLLDEKSEFALKNRYVENINGRRRYFKQGPLTSYERAKIERMAGNFPVQSFAADIFRLAYVNINKRLIKEGLNDKVFISMLIHDEMVCSVHKSVNPYYVYKLITEEVMISIDGHPPYYAGISVCDSWYEGKSDLYEAPVEFVMEQIKKPENQKYNPEYWCDDPKTMVVNDIIEYMRGVYIKETLTNAKKHGVSFTPDAMDLEGFMPHFTDYFLKPRIDMYMGSYRKARTFYKEDGSKDKERIADDEVCASLEKVFADYWNVDKLRVKYPNEDWTIIDIDRGEQQDTLTKDAESFINEEELNEFNMSDDGDFVFGDDDLLLDDDELEDDKGDVSKDYLEQVSIPVSAFNQKPEEEEDEFEIVEYIDENGEKRTKAVFKDEGFKFTEDTRMYYLRDERMYINISGMSKPILVKLVDYLKNKDISNTDEKGYEISFILHGKITNTTIKIKDLNVEDLSKVTGESFFNMQLC